MATRVSEIVDISDDDEIAVIYATPSPVKKGATKSDSISVEDYRPRKLKSEILSSSPKSRIFKKPRNTESTFICEICIDEKPRNEIFQIQGCGHSYCSDCIGKHVASKLHDNITAVSCPFPGCGGLLEPHHCRPILPDQVFHRWGDALCEALILAKEKFYCPFKDCSALLVDDRDGRNKVGIAEAECPNCNRLFCGQCKVPWHSGIKCPEFQRLNKDERSSEDILLMNLAKNKRWARCPNCRAYVQKKGGCDHIKCRCGSQFLYSQGARNVNYYKHTHKRKTK